MSSRSKKAHHNQHKSIPPEKKEFQDKCKNVLDYHYGSSQRNFLKRAKSPNINTFNKDMTPPEDIPQKCCSNSNEVQNHRENKRLKIDDIIPDYIQKQCNEVEALEKGLTKVDLEELDYERNLRLQQIQSHIKKTKNDQKKIFKQIDDIKNRADDEKKQEREKNKDKEEFKEAKTKREEEFENCRTSEQEVEDKIKEIRTQLCSYTHNLNVQANKRRLILCEYPDEAKNNFEEVNMSEVKSLVDHFKSELEAENINFGEEEFKDKEMPEEERKIHNLNQNDSFGSTNKNEEDIEDSICQEYDGESPQKKIKVSLKNKKRAKITFNPEKDIEAIIDIDKLKEIVDEIHRQNKETQTFSASISSLLKNYFDGNKFHQEFKYCKEKAEKEIFDKENKIDKKILQDLESIDLNQIKVDGNKHKVISANISAIRSDHDTCNENIRKWSSWKSYQDYIRDEEIRRDELSQKYWNNKNKLDELKDNITAKLSSIKDIFKYCKGPNCKALKILYYLINEGRTNFNYIETCLNDLAPEIENLKIKISAKLNHKSMFTYVCWVFFNLIGIDLSPLWEVASDLFKSHCQRLLNYINEESKGHIETIFEKVQSIEKELETPTGREVKILRDNNKPYARKPLEESEGMTVDALNKLKLDPKAQKMFSKIQKNLSISNRRIKELREDKAMDCFEGSEPECYNNVLKRQYPGEIKNKLDTQNQKFKKLREKYQKKFDGFINNLKNKIMSHNEELEKKLKHHTELSNTYKSIISKLKLESKEENKISEEYMTNSHNLLNDIQTHFKSFQSILQKQRGTGGFLLNCNTEILKYSNEYQRTSHHIPYSQNDQFQTQQLISTKPRRDMEISVNEIKYCLLSYLGCKTQEQKIRLIKEKERLSIMNKDMDYLITGVKYNECQIEFSQQDNGDCKHTSATVIPFNEQLRIQYLDNEYKELVSNAGKELTEACTKYKNQHFRLRTGLATVFPAGNLEFNNIIAAVPPISNNESAPQLLEKVILSILDIMLDHEFRNQPSNT